MSATIFARECMGSFPEPSPEYRAAYDAWRSYYEQTDAFDRGVCGPSGKPSDAWRQTLIARNAASEHKRVRTLLDGLDPETVRQARDAAQRDTERR